MGLKGGPPTREKGEKQSWGARNLGPKRNDPPVLGLAPDPGHGFDSETEADQSAEQTRAGIDADEGAGVQGFRNQGVAVVDGGFDRDQAGDEIAADGEDHAESQLDGGAAGIVQLDAEAEESSGV